MMKLKMIRRKLKNNKGETLVETLVSLLIASFALIMLAGMVNSASKIILSNKDKMIKFYSGNNILDNYLSTGDVNEELGVDLEDGDITEGIFTFTIHSTPTDALESHNYSVNYVENNIIDKDRVAVYRKE